jgi:protein-S-isoprenylcysteine O-methyltransferase Ste14
MESLAAVLFVLRSPASRTSTSAWSWFTTVGGTFAPFLLRPTEAESDLAIGQVIQVAGAGMAIFSLASLNRSFGLLPAVRSVRCGGAYRVVRHPLYAAYTVQNLGYLTSNLSVSNCVVVALALGFGAPGAERGEAPRLRADVPRVHGPHPLAPRPLPLLTARPPAARML